MCAKRVSCIAQQALCCTLCPMIAHTTHPMCVDKILQMPFLIVASVSYSNGQIAKWVFDFERVSAGSSSLKAALGL